MAQRRIGRRQYGLMHHAQLAAQLRDGAGGVDGAQYTFPEAPPHGQQRIVGRHHVFIFGDVLQLSAAQVAGDFAEVGAPDLLHLRLGRRLFGQNDLACNVFDVPVTEHHLHRKASHQALQVRHTGQGRLAGADEQQLAIEMFGQGLGDFLYLKGFLSVGADVLLHFVQHNQGQREFTVHGQGGVNGECHLLAGDVLHLRKLCAE